MTSIRAASGGSSYTKPISDGANKLYQKLMKFQHAVEKVMIGGAEVINRDAVLKLLHAIGKIKDEVQELQSWGARLGVVPSKKPRKK